MQCHHAMHPTTTIPQAIGSNLTRQNQGRTHDSLGVSEVESQLSQWHAKISWLHFSFLHSTIHNHESSTCFHEHSTTYIGIRSKDTQVMQLHMLFTHSNNNINNDNIRINKKFKPTYKGKPTTTYSRA
ncbi:hypothetical protein GQ457_10G015210 [Hibiscus cannabinus]